MTIDFSQLDAATIYHLMTQAVIPRPVAWVLTDSGKQNYNLAPFSYFTPVSSQPPLLMISVGKKPGGEVKDTVRNVQETAKLVIHIASAGQAEQVTATAATLAHGESELTGSHIELAEFEGFDLPRVKDCPVALGCRLYEIKEIGQTPQHLIFAQVERVYLNPAVAQQQEGRYIVDALAMNPLSRLGGGEYATLERTFTVSRPR